MFPVSIDKNLLRPEQTSGERVLMKATLPSHFNYEEQNRLQKSEGKDFSKMLFDSLDSVNAAQNDANSLSVKAMYSPSEVEAHEVTIALAKANMSISIAKNVIDKSIQAYKEIINIR